MWKCSPAPVLAVHVKTGVLILQIVILVLPNLAGFCPSDRFHMNKYLIIKCVSGDGKS